MNHPSRLVFVTSGGASFHPETCEPAEPTPEECSLRLFDLSCARCGCHHIRFRMEFVRSAGELRLVCGGCGLTEKMRCPS